jgi:hypothetical protein
MICPDYDLNYPYYNNIFNGAGFTLLESSWNNTNKFLELSLGSRHAYLESYKHSNRSFDDKF